VDQMQNWFSDWSPPEETPQEMKLNDISFFAVGLSSKKQDLEIVGTGAAFDKELASKKALFELIERITSYEQLIANPIGLATPETNAQSKLSISNGISAAKELIERHQLLNSWYGLSGSRRIPYFFSYDDTLKNLYEWDALDFGQGVVGIFAFPHDSSNHPMIFGFGCADNQFESLKKAENECLQRYCFLVNDWNVPAEIEFHPTALFHQDFYLLKENHKNLKEWLSHSEKMPFEDGSKKQIFTNEFRFEDLTLPERVGNIFVIRAQSNKLFPLVFGKSTEYYLEKGYIEKPSLFGPFHPIA
jgi:hypothetical protein